MRISGTLLVVDSNIAITDFMAESLRDAGYTVAVAHSRATALAAIERQPPALVLLDDTIPGLSSSLLRAQLLRRNQANLAIITTTTRASVAAALARHGRWACLAKPFSIDELLAYVDHYLQPTRYTPGHPTASWA